MRFAPVRARLRAIGRLIPFLAVVALAHAADAQRPSQSSVQLPSGVRPVATPQEFWPRRGVQDHRPSPP